MNPAKSRHKAPREYHKHGHYTLKRALLEADRRQIDGRSSMGRALNQWRKSLIQDLGGKDAISTQQEALVDLAVKSKLLLDSIDGWLLAQPSLVNARKRALIPVVRERQTLADGLARYLTLLGLQKRQKPDSLQGWLHQED